ncbi:hypothetical protein [Halomarina rubra]|uniref:DUF8106 domain-containing protein n=1 Tax=Halomarina rubra TaxID=2071873 RepID=A0ABD6AYQ0_9EURY|nr:hypothetical protein [Halomarina rubra]
MSRADLRRPAPERTERRKATLFCPTCGHESHARRGDWVVEHRVTDDGRAVSVTCPTCERTLTVEPVFCE